jgi:methionine-rich copper-binding protein CopC
MKRGHCMALLAMIGVLPGTALAHAALLHAVPGSRAVLGRMPENIELCFNEAVEAKFSTIGLSDAQGKAVGLGATQATAGNPKCITAAVPALTPGSYTVKYHVLSRDGHLVDYGYRFSLAPAPVSQ